MIQKAITSLGLLTVFIAACGPRMAPGMGGTRESGQSKLMGETFAGKNACNPDNHERPFIIEWDATDMSQFESITATDVVVVKYEGCKLTVLDGCKDDSVRGSYGTYKPVEWTSGSLEKMEIKSEAELYANLPLGVASLGGRVSGGEQFRMEYYVAGTRSATRPAVYEGDIKENPGCRGATHFVYGYNLGAFALGSKSNTSVEADASLYGFGAGAKNKQSQSADKQGGDLGVCKKDSATEIEGCKAPIRLTLRKIEKGENPDVAARKAPETDAAASLAAKVDSKFEAKGKAGEHFTSARRKFASGDGKGCLKELNAHDRLNPKDKSTAASSGYPHYLRAMCVMKSGKCDAGKSMARKGLETMQGNQSTPEQIDAHVGALASSHCQGKMSDRDAMMQANQRLMLGKSTVAECKKNYATIKRLMGKVKPKGPDDTVVANIPGNLYVMASMCAAKAGDCKTAFQLYKDGYPPRLRKLMEKSKPEMREQLMRNAFEATNRRCMKKK